MNLVNAAALQAIVDAKGQGVDLRTAEVGEVKPGAGRDGGGGSGSVEGAGGDTESTLPRWGECHHLLYTRCCLGNRGIGLDLSTVAFAAAILLVL